MRVSKSTNDAIIKSSISDGDLILKGNDGGSEITALTLDMSEAGAATFNSSVTVGGYTLPTSDGTANQIIETDGSGTLTFVDKPAAGVSAGFAVAMAIAL